MELEEIKSKAIRGIVALTGRTIFLQAISAVAFFLLGIFLSPSAIGIFIIVTSLMRILTLFTDVGLGAALVQKKEELNDSDLKSAFTIQEALVIPVVLIGWALTPIVTRFAALDSSGAFLYQVLVFTLFLSSLKVIPSILMERKLAFEKQVLPQIVESLVFNFLVVFLAFKGFGVASYSWAILASALAGIPVYYYLSPWHVSLGVNWKEIRWLLSFGISYQGKSILAVIKDDLLTFVMSGVVGPSGIGYWGWAQRWSYFPFRFTVDSVTKVTFPAYARLQQNKDVLRIAIEKSLFGVSIFLFPILTLIAILIPSLITIVPRYSKWEPAVFSFWFLCAGAAISALSGVMVNALDAIGKVKITLVLMVFWIILTWIFTIGLVAKFGFTGISAASFLVSTTIIITIFIVKRFVEFSFTRNVIRQVFACFVMGLFSIWLAKLIPVSIIQIIAITVFGGIIYSLTIFILAGAEIKENTNIVIKAFKK